MHVPIRRAEDISGHMRRAEARRQGWSHARHGLWCLAV